MPATLAKHVWARCAGWVCPLAVGVACLAAALFVACSEPPATQGIPLIRPWASAADLALWHREWQDRAAPHVDVPDPPGEEPVQKARYHLSRGSYPMEVRRRGNRFNLEIHGVDEQVMGGGWTACAEGTITDATAGATHPFAGSVATFTWSCLGIRYRHASDGVGRLRFSADGKAVFSQYMAFEDAELWLEAEGIEATDVVPERGTLHGQAIAERNLGRLSSRARYGLAIEVRGLGGTEIPGAIVQMKGQDSSQVVTDAAGRATVWLEGGVMPVAPVVAAGAIGWYNREVAVFADDVDVGWRAGEVAGSPVRIELLPIPTVDDPTYSLTAPHPDSDPNNAMACGTCHMGHYQDWLGSGHARSAENGHVEWWRESTIRAGASVQACDACHRPGRVLDGAAGPARGLLDGNHCDLCHKIQRVGDVRGAGVLEGSLAFLRPSAEDSSRPGSIHLVFGTRVDAGYAYMGASWNPLFATSHLCAGCHQGSAHGDLEALPKLNTFEEWRAYAEANGPSHTKSCQDCHMAGGQTANRNGSLLRQLAWDALHRTPEAVHDHTFVGVSPQRLAEALDVRVKLERVAPDRLQVRIAVENVGAGHRVPTGTWTKHLVLGVWARAAGKPLALLSGDRAWLVEESATSSDPLVAGSWLNPMGTVFGVFPANSPEAPFASLDMLAPWLAEHIDDRRLEPGAVRNLVGEFSCPPDAPCEVEVRVVHRRGALGAGVAHTPWTIGPGDAPPEMLVLREVHR